MHGRVVHFEIPFDDGERARTFYAAAFGWHVLEVPEMGYTMVSTGPSGEEGPTEPGYIDGGMMQRGDALPVPNLVIHVDNIEDALDAVTAAGGTTISGRQAVGEWGFAAYFKDTEGNLLGVWESVSQE